MNSISQNYNKNRNGFFNNNSSEDSCTCKTNCMLLQCGKPKSNIIQLPLLTETAIMPTTLDTITVDTSCFHDSKIQLDFTLNVTTPIGGQTSNLNLNVFKFYNNGFQSIPVGTLWSYTFSIFPGINQLLTFLIFDCNTFKYKEYTYILQATAS